MFAFFIGIVIVDTNSKKKGKRRNSKQVNAEPLTQEDIDAMRREFSPAEAGWSEMVQEYSEGESSLKPAAAPEKVEPAPKGSVPKRQGITPKKPTQSSLKKTVTIEEEPSKWTKEEKKKLILYSEILKPKFEE